MKQHWLRNQLATLARVAVEGMRGTAYGLGAGLLADAAFVAFWPNAFRGSGAYRLLIVFGPYGGAAIGALLGIVRGILRSAES